MIPVVECEGGSDTLIVSLCSCIPRTFCHRYDRYAICCSSCTQSSLHSVSSYPFGPGKNAFIVWDNLILWYWRSLAISIPLLLYGCTTLVSLFVGAFLSSSNTRFSLWSSCTSITTEYGENVCLRFSKFQYVTDFWLWRMRSGCATLRFWFTVGVYYLARICDMLLFLTRHRGSF